MALSGQIIDFIGPQAPSSRHRPPAILQIAVMKMEILIGFKIVSRASVLGRRYRAAGRERYTLYPAAAGRDARRPAR